MIVRLVRPGHLVACAVLVACVGEPAFAQSRPSPAPTAAPAPPGFTARAHADVSVQAQGQTFSGSVQLAVAQRDALVRVDVLSLHSDTLPVPPITATLVIDHNTRTVTAWNDSTRTYHVQRFELPHVLGGASPSPSPAVPSPRPSAAPRRAAPRMSALRDLDVLAFSMKLTGHTMTAGVPTSGLAFDFQVAKKGARGTTHVTATTQLADDYPVFPMTIDASAEPGSGGLVSKLTYAVDSLVRELPPPSRFTVPAGYTDAGSLFAVLAPGHAGHPTPAPSPAPH